MRRFLFCTALLLILSLILCSCSQNIEVDLNELMQSVNETFSVTDMTAVESADELYTLFLIEEDDISDFSAEYSAESDIRGEIILIKAKDKNAAFQVKTTLYNRLDSFQTNSKSYSPEEYAILEKCSVNVYNDIYVTLVIHEKAEEIDRYLKENLS